MNIQSILLHKRPWKFSFEKERESRFTCFNLLVVVNAIQLMKISMYIITHEISVPSFLHSPEVSQ